MADPREDARAMLALLVQSMAAQEPLRSQAEKQLEQLHQQPLSASFVLALCEQIILLLDASNTDLVSQVDPNLRLMACIWLKHFVKRSWKSSRHWSDDERTHLRHVLLSAALQEPATPVAIQLALVVATIARGDFPAQWTFEQLFSPMMQALQEGSSLPSPLLRQRRCTDVCYRLAKELATRRLLMHRKQFAMLSVELLPLALQHWCRTTQRITNLATDDSASMGDQMGMLLISTKLISTLLVNSFRDLSMLQNGDVVRATLVQFYEQLEKFVALRHAVTEANRVVLDKICFRMASLVVSIQKAYPIEFRAYLSPFLTLFWNVTSLPQQLKQQEQQLPRRLQIEAMQFVSNVVSCRLYKSESLSSVLTGASSSIVSKVITAAGDVSLTDAMVLEAQAAVDAFFGFASADNSNRLEQLLHVVVLHYMKLQRSDLDDWQSDPEAFVILSESLTAQESVRACAENLFLTLLQTFPSQTVPVLTQLTTAASTWLTELTAATASPRALDIDAVLLAIGLGCYDLHDCFEFEPWFMANLAPLLVSNSNTDGSTAVPVLKYRIVWLVSCWLAQLSAEIRAPLYDALLQDSLFSSQGGGPTTTTTDAALKLRIVETLEAMVSDWGFDRHVFVPFLPRALQCLYSFFPQTCESESKMKVLSCVEAMLQACGGDVVSMCEQISAPLPAMWDAGGEAENLVRGKILQLLAKLLGCVKECEPSVVAQYAGQLHTLHAMCLQVVRFATDVSNPDEVFLMESGLELWAETMGMGVSQVYSEELHLLVANALRLMERDYEHVTLVLTLLELYVARGRGQFWQTYHGSVGSLLDKLVGNVKAEASCHVARVVEQVALSFPCEQLVECRPVVTRMVEACLQYQQEQQQRRGGGDSTNSSSNACVEPESVVVAYLSVVARLFVQHPQFTVVHLFAKDVSVLVALVDLMLSKFFVTKSSLSMAGSSRKVWAVAFCTVLDLMEMPVLDRLGPILDACADVVDEQAHLVGVRTSTSQAREQQGQGDTEDADEADDGVTAVGAYRAYQSHRRKTKQQQQMGGGSSGTGDAVAAVDLRELVRAKLAAIDAALGPELFAQLLGTVDSSVLAKFQ